LTRRLKNTILGLNLRGKSMGLELKHRIKAALTPPISRAELARSIDEAERQIKEGTHRSIGEVMLDSGRLKPGEQHYIHRFSRDTTRELPAADEGEIQLGTTFEELFGIVREELSSEEDLKRVAVAVGNNLGCEVYLIASDPKNTAKTTLILARYPDGHEEVVQL
jgi:hypothetical protein